VINIKEEKSSPETILLKNIVFEMKNASSDGEEKEDI